MYLLDTVILAEMRKREPDAGVVRWLGDKATEPGSLSKTRLELVNPQHGARRAI